MPKGNRSLISLECTVCKDRNYVTTKNRRKQQDKLEMSKFCRKVPQAHRPQRRQGRLSRLTSSLGRQ